MNPKSQTKVEATPAPREASSIARHAVPPFGAPREGIARATFDPLPPLTPGFRPPPLAARPPPPAFPPPHFVGL
jgi:hypothetical protein